VPPALLELVGSAPLLVGSPVLALPLLLALAGPLALLVLVPLVVALDSLAVLAWVAQPASITTRENQDRIASPTPRVDPRIGPRARVSRPQMSLSEGTACGLAPTSARRPEARTVVRSREARTGPPELQKIRPDMRRCAGPRTPLHAPDVIRSTG